jgi:hypothetical protein
MPPSNLPREILDVIVRAGRCLMLVTLKRAATGTIADGAAFT